MNPQTIAEMEGNMGRLNAMLQDRIARGSAIGSREVAAAMTELAKAIAAYRYGVSPQLISQINTGAKWRHV